MEIKLKPSQLQILSNIQLHKKALEEEFTRLTTRESEIVAVICEANDAAVTGPVSLDVAKGTLTITPEIKKAE
jgi:hypothetical protein